MCLLIMHFPISNRKKNNDSCTKHDLRHTLCYTTLSFSPNIIHIPANVPLPTREKKKSQALFSFLFCVYAFICIYCIFVYIKKSI
jgi:hypothetical protein